MSNINRPGDDTASFDLNVFLVRSKLSSIIFSIPKWSTLCRARVTASGNATCMIKGLMCLIICTPLRASRAKPRILLHPKTNIVQLCSYSKISKTSKRAWNTLVSVSRLSTKVLNTKVVKLVNFLLSNSTQNKGFDFYRWNKSKMKSEGAMDQKYSGVTLTEQFRPFHFIQSTIDHIPCQCVGIRARYGVSNSVHAAWTCNRLSMPSRRPGWRLGHVPYWANLQSAWHAISPALFQKYRASGQQIKHTSATPNELGDWNSVLRNPGSRRIDFLISRAKLSSVLRTR